jgi:capsular polysaccharide transport system permease protein
MSSHFGKSRVGFFWVLVEPVAHLFLPVAIAGLVRRMLPGVEYPVFLVYGFLPFLIFKTVCMQTMEGTRANRGLLAYRQVLLLDVFVAKAVATCVVETIVFLVVLTALAMLGFDVLPLRPLELAGVLLLAALLAFGLGLLFAALGSVAPDTKSIIRIMFMPLYFMSGILFPISRFPDAWVQWLAINPVLHLVELTRASAVDHYEPMRHVSVLYLLALTLSAVFGGLALYRLRYLSRVTT